MARPDFRDCRKPVGFARSLREVASARHVRVGILLAVAFGLSVAACDRERSAERPEPPSKSVTTFKAGENFRECNQCPEMVGIPAGDFMMGSPGGEVGHLTEDGPRHQVTIARPFALGKYEVTFDEWDACVAEGGCVQNSGDEGWGRARRPLINVSWEDAQAYVSWMSKRVGKPYRLLTEAEWEYAARAGTTTRYPWGDDPGTNRANFWGSGSKWSGQTSPVGSFDANKFGLHDMIGNVWEWVQDCWNDSYNGAPGDGRAWESGDCGQRVIRGGSWNFGPLGNRAASRSRVVSRDRGRYLGFRVARTL
jgi:formylglycine-generating enzyme required for sulfatase activity